MCAEGEQGVIHLGLLIEIDDDRNSAGLRGAAYLGYELREFVVYQYGIDIGHQFVRVLWQRVTEFDTATRRDCFLTGRVEQDERYRCCATGNTRDPAAIDTFLGEIGKDANADSVIGAAQRASKGDTPTKPRGRHRRVGRATPAGDYEVARGDFRAWSGKVLHAHDDILDRDAGAQDFRRFGRTFSQS